MFSKAEKYYDIVIGIKAWYSLQAEYSHLFEILLALCDIDLVLFKSFDC